MMRTIRSGLQRLPVFLMISMIWALSAYSQIKLPRLISDGMVLQRGENVRIWGWASKGEVVSVRFRGVERRTTTGKSGEWTVVLPKQKPGGPYTLDITGSNLITIRDIMVGDVWVCSGQSNMELPVSRVSPIYKTEIASSYNPAIRQFAVPQKYDFNASQEDLGGGNWTQANPENVLKFSAVAYFFARELYEKHKVPIGLINASLGGAPAEAFMSEDALQKYPAYYKEAVRFRDSSEIVRIESADKARIDQWYTALQNRDAGYSDSAGNWRRSEIDTSAWSHMNIPGYWADQGLGVVNGVFWFRRTFDVPGPMTAKPAQLILGRIVDADSAFVNGVFVGTVSYQYPPRRYDVPPGVLKAGTNVLVVRVINSSGKGGFVPDKPYQIVCEGNTINLKGEWLYRMGARMDPLGSQTFIRWKPLGLYNAMISPLLNYSMKGAIWYQGESNTSRAREYYKLFPDMIDDWRKHWKQGDFPFLFVQLANFMAAKKQPSESDWAMLRDAQLQTLSVRKTGMAVTIDIGEWNDIHPLNKKDVGRRLALAAEKVAYGERSVVYSGPLYKSMKVVGNKAVLTFSSIGTGLVVRGDVLKQFAIAGQDGQFVWGTAEIQNNKVIVWSDQVEHPVAVRYAWADNPEGANLYNKEGLPASPFRTDK